MYWAATPASTSTSHSAAWTTFLVVTTQSAANTIMKAMIPNPTFWATLIESLTAAPPEYCATFMARASRHVVTYRL